MKAFLLLGVLGVTSLPSLGCHWCARQPAATPAAPIVVPAVPAALNVPAGAQPVARFHATGAQVYTCAADAKASFAWALKRPDAILTDDVGRAAGSHDAGPRWTYTDGSGVVGKKLAQADAPDATAIPWLLVGAASNVGTGLFGDVTFIQRVATKGGKAPNDGTGCGADNVGAELRVPYTADYVFFRGGK